MANEQPQEEQNTTEHPEASLDYQKPSETSSVSSQDVSEVKPVETTKQASRYESLNREMHKKNDQVKIARNQVDSFKNKARCKQLDNERVLRYDKNSIMSMMSKRLKYFAIIALQLIIIGCVFEYYFGKGGQLNKMSAQEFMKHHLAEEQPYNYMGNQARKFKNLKEVENAKFASVKDFPVECQEARDWQRLMVGRQRLPLEVVNSIGMRFRMIPAPRNHTFKMGSLPSEVGRGENEILHDVQIKAPFYMGKYEVTQKEWEEVRFKWDNIRKNPKLLEEAKTLGHIPKKLIEEGLAPNPSFYSMKFHNLLPINNITWYEAYYFGIALSVIEGVKIGTYRLPLEREWEWACRGGSPYAYAFGNDATKLTYFDVYGKNSYFRLFKVGTGLPNSFGLYNMHGNVFEWCYDVFHIYPGAKEDEYDGITRSIRGGNYRLPADSCRCAERMRLGEKSHGSVLGFRLIRTVYDGVYEQEDVFSADRALQEELDKLNQSIVIPQDLNRDTEQNLDEKNPSTDGNLQE